jgi:hypothetical protein
MPQFSVVRGDGGEDGDKTVMQAGDVREVLAHVAQHFSGQAIDLWREGEYLGRLRHIIQGDASYWHLE